LYVVQETVLVLQGSMLLDVDVIGALVDIEVLDEHSV
jgi:hypothetical protein